MSQSAQRRYQDGEVFGFQKGHRGYLEHHTDATKKRISMGRMGEDNPGWKGGRKEIVCLNCKKTFIPRGATQKYCSRKCSDSCPLKAEKAKNKLIGKHQNLARNWRGGLTNLDHLIRTEFKYRQWRSDVFTRDDFTCQKCGQRGGRLHAHHIKYFSSILSQNKITTLEHAFQCEELWNINNGVTLCQSCHKKIKHE